jgi:hypothetical protein
MAREDDELPETAEPAAPTTDQVTIDLNDVDDDDGPDKGASADAPEGRKGRRAQTREIKERARKSEERVETLERQLAELRGAVSVRQQQPVFMPAPTQTDPLEAELESLEQQQQLLLHSVQNPNSSQEDVDKASKQWRKLERQRRELEVNSVLSKRQPQNDVSEERIANQMLVSEFPEVFVNNEPMRLRAMAEMTDMLARGKPKSIATAREACERVLTAAGLRKGKAPAPSASQQSRYTSVPSRAGTASSASGQYTPTQNVLRTARAYTSHIENLSDEERVRKWVREVGKPNGLV